MTYDPEETQRETNTLIVKTVIAGAWIAALISVLLEVL